eukprot:s168_g9.t1
MGRSPLSGLADTMLGWAADAGRRLRRQLIVLDMHAAVPVSRIVVHQGGGEDGPIARYCHASWDLYEDPSHLRAPAISNASLGSAPQGPHRRARMGVKAPRLVPESHA